MGFLTGTILPYLTMLLSFVFPIVLVIGTIICLKRSFIEGALFFILILVYVAFALYPSNNLVLLPTVTGTVSKLLLIAAFSILILGIWRKHRAS